MCCELALSAAERTYNFLFDPFVAGLDSVLRLQVTGQGPLLPVGHTTELTGVHWLPGVQQQVVRQRGLATKTFITETAGEHDWFGRGGC